MDQSLQGATGKPFRMVVEEGKIREFSRATKSRHAAYHQEDGAFSPVTFLITAAFWQGPENSPWGEDGLNWSRVLHGEQEFVFHGKPPPAGTVLTVQARIDRIYEKHGKRGGTMTLAELVTEFHDQSGKLVAESRSTVIETAQAPDEVRDR